MIVTVLQGVILCSTTEIFEMETTAPDSWVVRPTKWGQAVNFHQKAKEKSHFMNRKL